ncbi:MAG: response regulator transcription factor [Nitriliruptorales bacterium]|nr:response regulator transcription factor [Nitriliruptorales bacterium]
MEATDPLTAGPIRVVLAEDHALVREGTRRILEATANISVVAEAANGEEALSAVEEHEPDVAILDIGMPVMNGIETTRRLKETHPHVAVLALTVHDDDQYVFTLLEAGAAGYLLKDVEGRQLVQAVEAVHAGESVLHPAITHRVLSRLTAEPAAGGPNDTALTDREHEVLQLAARGLPNKQIATELDVSVRTVQSHLTHVFRKLDVGSRTEAVLHGLRQGWFQLEDLEPPS